MFKKLCATALCLATYLATCGITHAALVTYKGYTLDEGTNIVTGGGLQWLQWDETNGMSINDALTTYASDDWRLATNAEMAALFNVFKFGKPTPWTDVEDLSQQIITPYQSGEPIAGDPENEFMALFGTTFERDLTGNGSDNVRETRAIYGSDTDNDGKFKLALVRDDSDKTSSSYTDTFFGCPTESAEIPECDNVAVLYFDWLANSGAVSNVGVALVRADTQPPTAVSEPPMLILFGTALALITYRRRKAQK